MFNTQLIDYLQGQLCSSNGYKKSLLLNIVEIMMTVNFHVVHMPARLTFCIATALLSLNHTIEYDNVHLFIKKLTEWFSFCSPFRPNYF